MTHDLKIKQEYAEKYHSGLKPWELRKNDRNFKVGDVLWFTIIETGDVYSRTIIYLFEGGEYGLKKGYCIMTLES